MDRGAEEKGDGKEDEFDDTFMAKADSKFDDMFRSGDVTEGAKRLRSHTFSSRISLRHILIVHREALERRSARTNQTVLRSKDEAREILEGLVPRVTPQNFGQMARENSDCEYFDCDGDLGVVEPGMYALEFDDAAYELQQGELSDIVESERGYHLIMRER